jgi:hypothetical protein
MAAAVVVLPSERTPLIGWLGKINFISCSKTDVFSLALPDAVAIGLGEQQNSAGEKLFIGGGECQT